MTRAQTWATWPVFACLALAVLITCGGAGLAGCQAT